MSLVAFGFQWQSKMMLLGVYSGLTFIVIGCVRFELSLIFFVDYGWRCKASLDARLTVNDTPPSEWLVNRYCLNWFERFG